MWHVWSSRAELLLWVGAMLLCGAASSEAQGPKDASALKAEFVPATVGKQLVLRSFPRRWRGAVQVDGGWASVFEPAERGGEPLGEVVVVNFEIRGLL